MTTSPDEPKHSPRPESPLRQLIADEIRRDGPIPFSRYMEKCLYEPELGYYSRPREQFGKAGDFYTSSDVHAVFGRLLARQFEEMWRVLDSPSRIDIIELGPGRGLFARDVLDWSAHQFPEFSRTLHYVLVEQSVQLRERLQERLAEHIAKGKAHVFESLEESTPTAGKNLIVFGNEFFDALPVEVIDHRGELRIAVENGRFVETFVPPTAAEVEFLDRHGVQPQEGERVEATLVSLQWMERIATAFHGRRGFLVLIDYGYTREEQLTGRHRDTIMSYRQHTASTSPYEAPGEQDITAHVNFTALQARGVERGLNPVALLTQSQFLLGIGEETQFADAFQDCKLPQEHAKVALQLKHLISPTGMGETFQVLLMSARVAKEKAAALSGLKLAH
ncbi:MAG: SAM-dependent methyltransferase [Candidatus Korobacteraceae bacterium]